MLYEPESAVGKKLPQAGFGSCCGRAESDAIPAQELHVAGQERCQLIPPEPPASGRAVRGKPEQLQDGFCRSWVGSEQLSDLGGAPVVLGRACGWRGRPT